MPETITKVDEESLLDLPSDWSKKTIEEIAIINRENANPTKEFPEEEFTYIDISNVESGGTGQIVDPKKIIGKEAPSRAKRFIQKDDVILSTVRPYLKSYAIVPQEYDGEICSTGYAVLTAKDKTDPHFLLYSCLTSDVQEQFKRMMRGANYPALNLGHVKQTTVPYPPFTEQRKIASILTTVQDAIEQTEAVIQATRELKESMIKHVFTYSTVPVDQTEQVKLKETSIGLVPDNWKIKSLEEVCEINQTNVSPPKDFPKEIFRYIDISNVESGTGIINSPQKILGEDAPSRAKRLVTKGDIILSTVRPYLKSYAIISKEHDGCICSTGYAVLTAKEDLSTEFIYNSLFTNPVQNQFKRMMRGANYPAININHVKQTQIALPDKETQILISEYLSKIDRKLRAEFDRKRSLKAMFESLLENLMTAKVRVV